MVPKMLSEMAKYLTNRGWKVWTNGEMDGPIAGLTHPTKSPETLLTYGQAFDLEMSEEYREKYPSHLIESMGWFYPCN